MTRLVALLDANVLYPAPIRDLLLQLAAAGHYHARWSDDIHDEWIRNVLINRPDLDIAQLTRTRQLMDRHVRDARVEDYDGLIAGLTLPDLEDRHVLAAAIAGGANYIVSFNLKDFPAAALLPHGIEPVHPDDFLMMLYRADTQACADAVAAILTRLRNPPVSRADYLVLMRALALNQFANAIAADHQKPDRG